MCVCPLALVRPTAADAVLLFYLPGSRQTIQENDEHYSQPSTIISIPTKHTQADSNIGILPRGTRTATFPPLRAATCERGTRYETSERFEITHKHILPSRAHLPSKGVWCSVSLAIDSFLDAANGMVQQVSGHGSIRQRTARFGGTGEGPGAVFEGQDGDRHFDFSFLPWALALEQAKKGIGQGSPAQFEAEAYGIGFCAFGFLSLDFLISFLDQHVSGSEK